MMTETFHKQNTNVQTYNIT